MVNHRSMDIAERIRFNTRHRQGQLKFVGLGLLLFVGVGVIQVTEALIVWDVERFNRGTAMSLLMLGIFIPMLSLFVIGLTKRVTGTALWSSMVLGGLISASGPFLLLYSGSDWDTPVTFRGRWGNTSELTLTGFTWMAWIVAMLLLAGAVFGWWWDRRANRKTR